MGTAVRLTSQVLGDDVLQVVFLSLAMVTDPQFTNLDRLPIPDLPGRVDPEVSLLYANNNFGVGAAAEAHTVEDRTILGMRHLLTDPGQLNV